MIELRAQRAFRWRRKKEVFIRYEGQEIGRHRLDILVEGRVIVELKTAEELHKAHYAQVRSYLQATTLSTALLVNFTTSKADYRRIEQPPSPHLTHPTIPLLTRP